MIEVLDRAKSRLVPVPTEAVADVWPDVVGLVRKAMLHGDGRYGLSDIFDGLTKGPLELWVAEENRRIVSVAVAEAINYPRMRVCYVGYMAGRLRDLIAHRAAFEAHYAGRGCSAIEAWSRKGFSRVLDYEPKHVLLRKRIAP